MTFNYTFYLDFLLDLGTVENDLISEVRLSKMQAKVFLLIVNEGKMTSQKIAEKLNISTEDAEATAKKLMELGGLIDLTETEFETMHPRFTAVNMYRRMCEREKKDFKKNVIVDNIGIALEKPYEDARTKK